MGFLNGLPPMADDAVDRGLSVQMYPDFKPSLAWLATDDGSVGTLLPLDGPVPSEAGAVSVLSRCLLPKLATGIEHGQSAGGVPALLRWSKFGGEELSRIVDRCPRRASSKSVHNNVEQVSTDRVGS